MIYEKNTYLRFKNRKNRIGFHVGKCNLHYFTISRSIDFNIFNENYIIPIIHPKIGQF
jgi:hypothetical protein